MHRMQLVELVVVAFYLDVGVARHGLQQHRVSRPLTRHREVHHATPAVQLSSPRRVGHPLYSNPRGHQLLLYDRRASVHMSARKQSDALLVDEQLGPTRGRQVADDNIVVHERLLLQGVQLEMTRVNAVGLEHVEGRKLLLEDPFLPWRVADENTIDCRSFGVGHTVGPSQKDAEGR
eukprot:753931-Hanusia_phi.AAC.2